MIILFSKNGRGGFVVGVNLPVSFHGLSSGMFLNSSPLGGPLAFVLRSLSVPELQ